MTNKEITNAYYGADQVEKIYLGQDLVWEPPYQVVPVLNIGGQQIQGTLDSGNYVWDLSQSPSNGPFTITENGTPITADTYQACGYYYDDCTGGAIAGEGGIDIECKEETGVTQFNTNYLIQGISYNQTNNYVEARTEEHYPCPCDNWEGEGYSSYEECMCAIGHTEYCEEPADSCENWEDNGYSSYEECMCVRGFQEYCPDPCDDWEGNGYSSYEDCTCAERGENCEEPEGE